MNRLDLTTWNRREHFNFFKNFDEPFWGMVADVDCTEGYNIAKEKGFSFFAWYLYKSLVAANEVEEFRYRINDSEVLVYDSIHASSTIGRKDGTFAFSFVQYNKDFQIFTNDLKEEVIAINESSGLRANENAYRTDVIHYSTIPWSSFSSLTHARNFKVQDSAPKITFGKSYERHGQKMMPVAIYIHHGLADAYHVTQFLESFQNHLNTYED